MITEILNRVQQRLKAPKSQRNAFGGYNYRSCEDILESVKPILATEKATVTLTDDIVLIGERYYVKATATITANGESISTTAYAREEENKKGMDGSQITGASSSYARKYALNGLFAIDDTKDSDATNTHGKETAQNKPAEQPKAPQQANRTKPEQISPEIHEQAMAYPKFDYTKVAGYLKKTVDELTDQDINGVIEKQKANAKARKVAQ